MLGLRHTIIPQFRSRVNLQINIRKYSTKPVETSIPAPAAEAQQHQQVVQQQTQNAVAPQSQTAKAPPEDDGLYWTALGLLFITPPVVYYWYQHRKEHMGRKKEELLQKLAEKRAAFQKEMGK